ncbi:MAG TPA: serine/threonine-protein kinase [Pirellulaceae bacterium]|nr:serine/threonine-protein kinase [Pirellulaceae bacterium]
MSLDPLPDADDRRTGSDTAGSGSPRLDGDTSRVVQRALATDDDATGAYEPRGDVDSPSPSDQAASDDLEDLLAEIVDEFTERLRKGESPSIAEYRSRHPELADDLDELLPTIASMEKARSESAAPASTVESVPSRLGDFEIREELGRGGMGIVFAAFQRSLQRRVALKILPRALLLDERHKLRFEREARIAANLHHTNIVPVFGVGEDQGYRFYVMQLIEGRSLAEIVDELRRLNGITLSGSDADSGPLPLRTAALRAKAELQAAAAAAGETTGANGTEPSMVRRLAQRIWKGAWSDAEPLAGPLGDSDSSARFARRPDESSHDRSANADSIAARAAAGRGSGAPTERWNPNGERSRSGERLDPDGSAIRRSGEPSASPLLRDPRLRDGSRASHVAAPKPDDGSRAQVAGDRPSPAGNGAIAPIVEKGTSDRDAAAERPTSMPSNRTARRRAKPVGFYREVAEIGRQAARALHYSHEHGLLHRDMKPGNLLLDQEGRVWVADFGLARAFQNTDVSRSGEIVGTWRYMAPEQWQGKATARSDLFGLGAALHELVTLRQFREGEAGPNFGAAQRGAEVPRPRSIDPAIPRDLETILLRCLAADPTRRYVDAAALADDLDRFLEGRPIRARRVGPIERTIKWIRRNPAAAALSVTVAALILVVMGLTGAAYRAEAQKRTRAVATRTLAIEAIEKILRELDLGPVTPDTAALEDDDSTAFGFHSQGTVSPDTARVLRQLVPVFDRLASLDGTDPELTAESARAYQRIGDIELRLGNPERSRDAYAESLSRYALLGEARGTDEQDRSWARTNNQIALSYLLEGRRDEAQVGFSRTIEWCEERVVEPSGSDPWLVYEYARAYHLLGITLRQAPVESLRRMSDAGRTNIRTVVDQVRDRLADARRDDAGPPPGPPPGEIGPGGPGGPEPPNAPQGPPPDAPRPPRDERGGDGRGGDGRGGEGRGPGRRGFGRNPFELPAGLPEQIRRDFQASQEAFRQGVELLEPIVEANPSIAEFRFTLALCYRDGSPPWRLRGSDGDPSNDLQQRAIDILETLVREAPTVPDYRLELADTIARVPPPDRMTVESLQTTEADLRRALGIVDDLLRDSGQVPRYRQAAARILERLAAVEWLRHGAAKPIDSVRRAWSLYSGLADDYPDQDDYLLSSLRIGIQLGQLLAMQRQWIESGRVYQDSLRRLEATDESFLAGPIRQFADTQIRLGITAAEEGLVRQLDGTEAAWELQNSVELQRFPFGPGSFGPGGPGGGPGGPGGGPGPPR